MSPTGASDDMLLAVCAGTSYADTRQHGCYIPFPKKQGACETLRGLQKAGAGTGTVYNALNRLNNTSAPGVKNYSEGLAVAQSALGAQEGVKLMEAIRSRQGQGPLTETEKQALRNLGAGEGTIANIDNCVVSRCLD